MLADRKMVRAGAPILYYRANTSGRTIDEIYSVHDNVAIIQVKESAEDKPRENLLNLPDNNYEFFDNYIRDWKITARAWPYRPDSYILISAGIDGLYGTDDDIRNFGN
jgi:hypothetical protein